MKRTAAFQFCDMFYNSTPVRTYTPGREARFPAGGIRSHGVAKARSASGHPQRGLRSNPSRGCC